MSILLSHISALEALRSPLLSKTSLTAVESTLAAPGSKPAAYELEQAAAILETTGNRSQDKVEVLVSDRAARMRTHEVSSHIHSAMLPPCSVIHLTQDVYCAGPALIAAQLAAEFEDLEVIMLLCELLGTYGVCNAVPGGMVQRLGPPETKGGLAEKLVWLRGMRGVGKARTMLRHACSGAASPQEAKTSLRFGLRPGLGGYGIVPTSMNETLITSDFTELLPKHVRKPDILFLAGDDDTGRMPFRGVALEYKGRDYHGTPDQMAEDARRRNELLAIGVKDYEIDKLCYDNSTYMDNLAEQIKRDLGRPRQRLSYDEYARRRLLRRRLKDKLDAIDGVHWSSRES